MHIRLRPADDGDYAFARTVFFETQRWIIEELFGWRGDSVEERRFAETYDPAATSIVVVDGEDAGWLTVHHGVDNVFLDSIFVRASKQRNGIGTALLRTLLDDARREGKTVSLSTARINPARRLYERLGFVTVGVDRYKAYLQTPEVRRTDGASAFGARADAYAACRPSYPRDAVASIFAGLGDPEALTVLDVGAGTGISTRLLAAFGARVLAIEPDARMRAASGAVELRDARAEATGFGDASFNVVCAFQAFHWFEQRRALIEFKRVLAPGGRLALVWNSRDDDHPASRSYGATFEGGERPWRTRDTISLLREFDLDDPRVRTFAHELRFDGDGLAGYARSTSSFPRDPAEGEAFLGRLRTWFERFAEDGVCTLRFQAHVYLAER